MWKKIQHALSVVADLLQIGGFLGLTPAILIAFGSVGVGWVSGVPVFYIFVGAIVVFAAAAYLTRALIVRIGATPLSEGARVAYEQLRGTLWAEAAERMRVDSSPNGILDYLATGLTLHIPIYGKYPPSTKLERIKASELKSGSIKEGASVLQLNDKHKTRITDLRVRKRDLRRAIHQMSESTAQFTR